ncbi:NAD(P)H dehydrogenase subunit NdhS [Prochlorococcus sp. AH-716-L04]|nr:NAD(P)H dehydrogenase subunit NdhS [Prochlorococcus sp. AH-716-L04]
MELSTKPILPGSFVVVKDINSIYRGYKGFVQRVTKNKAAVLFEGGNWDKLITFQLTNLEIV